MPVYNRWSSIADWDGWIIGDTIDSPVVDAGSSGISLSAVKVDFDCPAGTEMQIAFRASDVSFDQESSTPAWTMFTPPGQILTQMVFDLHSEGIFLRGRYQQMRVRFTPAEYNPFDSETAGKAWRFGVIGDTRSATDDGIGTNVGIFDRIVSGLLTEDVDFITFTGDLVYKEDAHYYNVWLTCLNPVINLGIPLYPVRGNHDTDLGGTAYLATFPDLPQNGPAGEEGLTYSFGSRTCFFVGVDEYVNAAQVNQTWLDAQFAANRKPHVFVMGHQPAFKVYHADCLDDQAAKRNTFWNSIKSAGGRTYFCGHDHLYDHARIDDGDGDADNDVHQLIVGTGGASLHTGTYSYNGNNSPFTPVNVLRDQNRYGYGVVEVKGLTVKFTYKAMTGAGTFVPVDVFSYTVPLLNGGAKIRSIEMNASTPLVTLGSATAAYLPGTVLAQIVNFSGEKKIDKVSLSLAVSASESSEVVEESCGMASFPACCFTGSRNAWVFQPVVPGGWESCGTSIENSLQNDTYSEGEVASAAPSLNYSILFQTPGVYDFWAYYFGEAGSFYWGLDGDLTNLAASAVAAFAVPQWTKMGSIEIKEGGIRTLTVYSRTSSRMVLDQWCFTTSDLQAEFAVNPNSNRRPLPLSHGPFMTAVRLRSLHNGTIDSLASPLSPYPQSFTSWLSSKNMIASGQFNYEIQRDGTGITFTDGVSLEYWQVGGGRNQSAAWAYSFPDLSAGNMLTSRDYGLTFTAEE